MQLSQIVADILWWAIDKNEMMYVMSTSPLRAICRANAHIGDVFAPPVYPTLSSLVLAGPD